MSLKFSEMASRLPTQPGVYLMRDCKGSVIYVGKAKSLKNRVSTYFKKIPDNNVKTRLMVSKIADFETIATLTEKEALILENNLIKKYRPKFNILFRDDKEYPYLKLSAKDSYPNLSVIRRPKNDGSIYFGPFASSGAVRETIKIIHKIFPIRKCEGTLLKKYRPCIYFQLKQCLAPCFQNVNHQKYLRVVRDVQLFLQGHGKVIIQKLKKTMLSEAKDLNFELAAQIRNQIYALGKTLEQQSVVCLDFVDRDVFSLFREGSQMAVTTLFVRSGKMLGSRSFFLKNLQLSDEESLSSIISQYYHRGEFIPKEIIVPLKLLDREVVEEWLKEKKRTNVKIINPQQGSKKELLKLAARNAEITFRKNSTDAMNSENILSNLQSKLHLKNLPSHIECFDISNILGTSAVGSMVVFKDGVPFKEGYRKFRIKTVHQPNDYAMMLEVLTRHIVKAKKAGNLPDLMIVDGGKGQLNVLLKAFHEHSITSVDAAALAKKKRGERINNNAFIKKTEKIFLPNRKNPVILPEQEKTLLLLQRIRDEAHRCAVSYYKIIKKNKDFTSRMQSIPGIGRKTVKAVLKHFGSMEQARNATAEKLNKVPCITKKRAALIYNFFRMPST